MGATVTPELKNLRRRCWGFYGRIAIDSGVDVSSVSRVMQGIFINPKVLQVAKDNIDRYEAERDQVKKNRINSVLLKP